MALGKTALLYGLEGLGKTSLALQFPNPVCYSINETGCEVLQDTGEVSSELPNHRIDKYEELLHHLSQEPEPGTDVIDALTGLAPILADYVCRTSFQGNTDEFHEYSKGAKNYIRTHLQTLVELFNYRMRKGRNVILIAHSNAERTRNPQGEDYFQYQINAHPTYREVLKAWPSMILFLGLKASVTKGKADEANRYIYTSLSPAHEAKNRYKLPPVISAGSSAQEAYKNLSEHLFKATT